MNAKNAINDIVGVDGVDYINIYSKGETELGRKTSHFSYGHFVHPELGEFDSMEAFWIFAKAADQEDPEVQKLRKLVGYQAKLAARTIKTRHVENFHELILSGNWHKFNQNQDLKDLMVNFHPELPFQHFYIASNGKTTIRPLGYEWLIKGFEDIRKRLILQARVLSGQE